MNQDHLLTEGTFIANGWGRFLLANAHLHRCVQSVRFILSNQLLQGLLGFPEQSASEVTRHARVARPVAPRVHRMPRHAGALDEAALNPFLDRLKLRTTVAALDVRGRAFGDADLRRLVASKDLPILLVDVGDRFGQFGHSGVLLLRKSDAPRVGELGLSCVMLGEPVEQVPLLLLGWRGQYDWFDSRGVVCSNLPSIQIWRWLRDIDQHTGAEITSHRPDVWLATANLPKAVATITCSAVMLGMVDGSPRPDWLVGTAC